MIGWFIVALILRNGSVVYWGQSVTRATASAPAAAVTGSGDHSTWSLKICFMFSMPL